MIRLRNKMDNNFFTDCMVIYIERKIVDSIDMESIIDELDEKSRKVKHN